jgi:ribonucleoside-diphosphate reductase alpha chain
MQQHKAPPPPPPRHRLPDERPAVNRRFAIYGLDTRGKARKFLGTIVVGLYEDGTPGEVFVYFDKEGSRARALLDAWATAVSIGLQHGIPLDVFLSKSRGVQFEPTGGTTDPEIPRVSSPLDYICRWIQRRFGDEAA